MKKQSILRVLAGALVAMSAVLVNPMSANAEWRQDSSGWWYANGNSYYRWWQKINGKWYYFSPQGYMQTGWTEYINYDNNENVIGSTFYYLSDDGSMDDSKTTNVRPAQIQNMYDKLVKFETNLKQDNEDLYLSSKLNNIGIKIINNIKPNFGSCYEFSTIASHGDAIDGVFYNDVSGSFVIANQGNYIIADTNETYSNLTEKSNHVNKIRQWVWKQNGYSNSVYDIKEEKDRFVIDYYSYSIYNHDQFNLVRSYVYDKATGEIKWK